MSKDYSIQRLLDNCVQPFPDLPEEEFEGLKRSIAENGGNPLQPIMLSADEHRMYSGAQRCQAMLELGRKYIDAKYVRVDRRVTKVNILEAAVEDNILRRHLTHEGKAQVMHTLARKGWSQRKIAHHFGMTQARVSQLMRQYPPADGAREPLSIRGADGKTYTRMPAPVTPPAPRPPREKGRGRPWQMEGRNFKAVVKALNVIREGDFPTGLTLQENRDLASTLALLIAAAEDLAQRMKAAGLLDISRFPAPDPDAPYTGMLDDLEGEG